MLRLLLLIRPYAHKILQDLKVKRQRVLSSPTIPAASPDGSLLAGPIP